MRWLDIALKYSAVHMMNNLRLGVLRFVLLRVS